ncbi:chemotaxis protein CheY [Streptomyces eurocidicus]|uniref:Transcriptional regulatory protein n=1 Tax=Streptomyces eurocidicus TaxID=66423 RepID=A0A2N8NWC5_STREU|nr:response regulator [Streptomyces eurocidicus]MBB5122173.1 response regulator of citrate/malate metabolism [Streptomyces eurocidicus]MBF6055557.1 response regulator [Streptomyces eurocidicus]PNE33066.1 chemotaxis protein CheY [Streptomyces eurocidicus]
MIEVLVVDDDFRVAEINAAYVARVPGFHVGAKAHNAAQAMAVLERGGIDLVLLDHFLPDETGLSLVRRIRQRGHLTDVIMVTASRDIATVQAAMCYGALQYLVKPFTFPGLRVKLEAYAQLRRTLDDAEEAGQDQVDRIFGTLRTAATSAPLPKGHSAPTAELIRRVLSDAARPLSAHEVAARSGLSRSTAQRYLKRLEESGRLRLTLKYGETGRPEHRYTWAVAG